MMGDELISIGKEGDRETFLGLKKVATGSSIGGECTGLGDARGSGAVPVVVSSVGFEAAGSLVTFAAGLPEAQASAAVPDDAPDIDGSGLAGAPLDWLCCSIVGTIVGVAFSTVPFSLLDRSSWAGG